MLPRCFLHAAAVVVAIALLSSPSFADKLTEANMTQNDYENLTSIESSEPGSPPELIVDMHDFSEAAKDAMKNAHAVRVIKGKEWRASSPKERDARIRAARKNLKPGLVIVVEIPSGDVWAVEVVDISKLEDDKVVQRWTKEEIAKLPVSVRHDPGTSHSDRHGSKLERAFEPDRP